MENADVKEMQFAIALSNLQGELEHVKRDTKAYNYKYAQLDQCWDSIKAPLLNNGFCFIQLPYNEEDRIGVQSILLHKTGQRVESKIAMKPVKADPQAVGSLITYLRRYSLMSVIGLCPVDDDAQAAMPTQTTQKERYTLAMQAISQCKTSEQLTNISKRIQASKFDEPLFNELNYAIENKLKDIMKGPLE